MTDDAKKFRRATDDELRENGFDPAWIEPDPDREGPFAPVRCDTNCGHCGHKTFGWSVVNLMTATGIGSEWTHSEAEVYASEHAGMLNAAWLEGFAAADPKGGQ